MRRSGSLEGCLSERTTMMILAAGDADADDGHGDDDDDDEMPAGTQRAPSAGSAALAVGVFYGRWPKLVDLLGARP
jgi:hypothetical protein